MTTHLEGVAAMLHTPTREGSIEFGELSPFPLLDSTPLLYERRQVGYVTELWTDTDLLRWRGELDDEPLPDITPTTDLRIPLPEPNLAERIALGQLVGVPHTAEGPTRQLEGRTKVNDWMLASMHLVPADEAPWPQVALSLRTPGIGVRAEGR